MADVTFIAKLGFNTPPLAAYKIEQKLDRYPVRLRRGSSFKQSSTTAISLMPEKMAEIADYLDHETPEEVQLRLSEEILAPLGLDSPT